MTDVLNGNGNGLNRTFMELKQEIYDATYFNMILS